MYEIVLVIFLLVAAAIVGLVLIQNGKGADMGASFGSGASATLFGASGTGNFLTRATSILGLLFFVVSLVLANFSSSSSKSNFANLQSSKKAKQVELSPLKNNKQKKAVSDQINSTSEIPE